MNPRLLFEHVKHSTVLKKKKKKEEEVVVELWRCLSSVLGSVPCREVMDAMLPSCLQSLNPKGREERVLEESGRKSRGSCMLCMFHFLSTTGHYFVSCRRSVGSTHHSPTSECPSDMLFFFFFVSKAKRYCSFKYCALHRIFSHKLLNIYIFFLNTQTYTFIYTRQ